MTRLATLVVLSLTIAAASRDVGVDEKSALVASAASEAVELARGEGAGCQCGGDTCGCCVDVSWSRIGMHGALCLNL